MSVKYIIVAGSLTAAGKLFLELNKFTGLLITKTNEGAPDACHGAVICRQPTCRWGGWRCRSFQGGTEELVGLSVSSQQGRRTR